jgi:hypothetical protein
MVAWAGMPGADATGGKGNLDGWGAVTAAMMGTLGSWDRLVQNDEDRQYYLDPLDGDRLCLDVVTHSELLCGGLDVLLPHLGP